MTEYDQNLVTEYFRLVSRQRQLRQESRMTNARLRDVMFELDQGRIIVNEYLTWQAD